MWQETKPRKYLLAAEAAIHLVVFRLSLYFPFRWQVANHQVVSSSPVTDAQSPNDPQAKAVGWAVARVAVLLPWTSSCLVRALAARWMLRRRGVRAVLHLGVACTDGRPSAHAWLEAGNGLVCGGAEAKQFVPLAGFSPNG